MGNLAAPWLHESSPPAGRTRMANRILVADDDPKQARLLKIYLEREGHSVLTVCDGRSALDLARTRKPDLLILDVMMPELDGLDVCRIVRAESQVPILLVTARTTTSRSRTAHASSTPGFECCSGAPTPAGPSAPRSRPATWRSTRCGSRFGVRAGRSR